MIPTIIGYIMIAFAVCMMIYGAKTETACTAGDGSIVAGLLIAGAILIK